MFGNPLLKMLNTTRAGISWAGKTSQYAYDGRGNCTVVKNVGGIADLNPFRYRSYYYDTDTKLYYLQSRYYDPELGRFISGDNLFIVALLGSEIIVLIIPYHISI